MTSFDYFLDIIQSQFSSAQKLKMEQLGIFQEPRKPYKFFAPKN